MTSNTDPSSSPQPDALDALVDRAVFLANKFAGGQARPGVAAAVGRRAAEAGRVERAARTWPPGTVIRGGGRRSAGRRAGRQDEGLTRLREVR
ncbi:hypothetical protein [Spongiactinospora sp. TRM90649]|uniref:hypothetical protein n=1 Tax=Spongiactinospora sp. TRM90649 TaxID=3031114 RepID=UPI0023F671A9|nr:hypothetical protein [Spongiactinospora sp. TRM90649]MDF5755782.1 hypothetical protein [Spongiactinospora sp. TRM90649]